MMRFGWLVFSPHRLNPASNLKGNPMAIIRTSPRWFMTGILIATLLATALLPARVQAQAIPPGFVLDTVVSGLHEPTSFAFAADGRIFISERAGAVRVVENGELLHEPFVNLDHEINSEGTRGLMGIALHPNFPRTPYLYMAYVYDPPEVIGYDPAGARVSRLLRVEANPADSNVHRPDGFYVMLGSNSTFENIGNPKEGDKPPFSCLDEGGEPVRDCLPAESLAHTIDDVRFGPDGALYVSNGDGTTNGKGNMRALDVDSLGGKILRINPINGRGYANNPFFDGSYDSNRSKVYALGLRNPFRFTFSPFTRELFIGDVGNFTWEEINRGRGGVNYGWPCYEGPEPVRDDPACDPIFSGAQPVRFAAHQYSHSDGFGSAIGGDFYTGRGYPAQYRNAYFFADFNKGSIQYLTFASNGAARVHDFAANAGGVVQFKRGPGGDLYLLNLFTGILSRLRYVGGAPATPVPVASSADVDEGAGAGDAVSAPAAVTQSANALPSGGGAGKISREVWTGIGGNQIDDLTGSPDYPDNPSEQGYLTALEGPRDGKDYGDRIRGYIHPPVSGQYRFWVASDDTSQLWLSTDANPANKRVIAGVYSWTPSRNWDKLPEQASVSIDLRAGQIYYIEVLHKQADQKNNFSVAWQPPGGEQAIIAGQYLSPFGE